MTRKTTKSARTPSKKGASKTKGASKKRAPKGPKPAPLLDAGDAIKAAAERNTTQPHLALVFHIRERSLALMTVHEMLRNQSGIPLLGPGRPLLPNDEDRLLSLLLGRDPTTKPRIPPLEQLYAQNGLCIWWIPPTFRAMYIQRDGHTTTINVMWPNLVAAVVGRTLYLGAVPGHERPTGASRVHRAPLGNVYENGKVCTGSAKLPPDSDPSYIPQWNRVICDTAFSHDNCHPVITPAPAQKRKKGAPPAALRGAYGEYTASNFWIDRDGVKEPIADDHLVFTGHSLDTWLAELAGGA